MKRLAVVLIGLSLLAGCAPAHAAGECPPLKLGSYWKCPAEARPGAPKAMGVTVRIQPRYSFTADDAGQPTFGAQDDTDANDGYNTRRIRVAVAKQLGDDWLGFVQVRKDWGMDDLKFHDFYVTNSSMKWASVTVGQMPAPFDRIYLMPDVQLPLAERPLVSTLLVPARQIGVMLHHQECGKRLGWQAGLFSGNGPNEWSAKGGLMPVARAEWVASPDLSLGINFSYKERVESSAFQKMLKKNASAYGLQTAYTARQVSETAWGVDALYQRDWLSVYAGYTALRAEAPGSAVNASGWYINFGKFIPLGGRKDKLEFVAGYEQFDSNDAVTDQLDARWTTFGLNY
ncbi:MAG: OprO/OprP family phosphate-selective porin, partial [Armatimonadetes bacterium]|nr:OprO/OprP family phosphate-selective porin [Armatimonadota bacterium]